MTLSFHPLTIADREAVQNITLHAGRRNCNYTFANLLGWQFLYQTEVCITDDTVVLRFNLDGQRGYMVCSANEVSSKLLHALFEDSSSGLTIVGLEDNQTDVLEKQTTGFEMVKTANRDQYDYLYLRSSLASLHGGHLNAKRNHVHHFREAHPDFRYHALAPDLFDECRRLTDIWTAEKAASESIAIEHRVMETVFEHWDELNMTGGCIFADDQLVAFSYGAAVTTDTFDVCIEKADRQMEGAFAIINQQFAQHLPEQFVYLNREDDMGIPGLRKAKLSYHPETLLTFNTVNLVK